MARAEGETGVIERKPLEGLDSTTNPRRFGPSKLGHFGNSVMLFRCLPHEIANGGIDSG
jgi:hypothetical protein